MGIDTECRLDVSDVVRDWQSGSLSNEGLMLRAGTDDSWWMHMPGGNLGREPRLVIVTAAPGGFAGYVAGLGLPGLAADSDDDRDGIPALVEYGLGLHPAVFDGHPGLLPDGGGYRLEWTKGEAAKGDPGIGYRVDWSTDLLDWEEAAGVEETSDAIGVTVLPSGAGFYRLTVTEG